MDSVLGPTLLFGIFLVLCSGVSAEDPPLCARSNACQCVLSNGSFINLESLASPNNNASFRQLYNVSGWVTYNPCKPFNGEEECQDAAVCLTEKGEYSSVLHTSLFGKQDSATWTKEEETEGEEVEIEGEEKIEKIIITYKFNNRNFKVSLKCDLTAKDSLNITNIADNTITAELTSKCACLGECSMSEDPSTPTKHSISTGTIIIILFFTLVFLYLVGGVIYNKIVNGATGKELIPNVEFWTAFPKLVLDGVAFTCNCCGSRKSTPGYDNV